MKNSQAIGSLGRHLSMVGDRINELAADMNDEAWGSGASLPVHVDLLLDDLEQAQKITLALTEVITDSLSEEGSQPSNTDGDGSAFAQGELQSVKGKPLEDPAAPDNEEDE